MSIQDTDILVVASLWEPPLAAIYLVQYLQSLWGGWISFDPE